MPRDRRVPDAVIKRLPTYYRYLDELENQNMLRISSQELGRRMGYTASQVRQDINCFGGFGHQGYGYEVPRLKAHIGLLLGLDQTYPMVIVGVGNLGRALANNPIFPGDNYRVIGLFDIDPGLIGTQVQGMTIQKREELADFLREHPVRIGIITTPASDAQAVADILISGGVEAIWNFAPYDVQGSGTIVHNVHLSDALLVLSYRINEGKLLERMPAIDAEKSVKDP